MKYVPVCIFTLNRYEHLKRCIDSLSRCTGATMTELFISVDYPPSEFYVEGYQKVVEYLQSGIEGFKNVYIFFQKMNLGPYKNAGFIQNKALENSEVWFLTEDDNEFAPNALEYINKCLEYFEKDEKIVSISTWNSINNWNQNQINNVLLLPYYSAWGVASWKGKYEKIVKQISYDYLKSIVYQKDKFQKLYHISEKTAISLMKALFKDYPAVYMSDKCTVAAMDVTFSIYNIVEECYQVQPVRSKVRNWGHDGSGINGGNKEQEKFVKMDIDDKNVFLLKYVFIKRDFEDNMKYFSKKLKSENQMQIMYYCFLAYLYRTFGEKYSRIFYKIVKKLRYWLLSGMKIIKRG